MTMLPLLNVADSEKDADQFYLSGIFVPDPFALIQHPDGRIIGLFNPLEVARAKAESRCHEVWSTSDLIEQARRVGMRLGRRSDTATLLVAWARLLGFKGFQVGSQFPFGLAEKLRKRKLKIKLLKGALCPEREIKSPQEYEAIRTANACSANGLARARSILREAKIGSGQKLLWQGKTLTSERLQEEIIKACLDTGGETGRVIAAGGEQACDPHAVGSGPLRAGELIIVDIFPRHRKSGYHGDMTRTFLKGQANPEQRRLVETVRRAQREAMGKVCDGASAHQIHQDILATFARAGYKTTFKGDQPEGFFHGTGHGLGLEVHEAPRVSVGTPPLREGQVVTIEPGLYYHGLGGCRIEDVVAVGKDGPVKLSSFPYQWEIA